MDISLNRFRDNDALSPKIVCFSTHPCMTPPRGETLCNINVIYTPLKRKVLLMGYNSVADIMGLSSFV